MTSTVCYMYLCFYFLCCVLAVLTTVCKPNCPSGSLKTTLLLILLVRCWINAFKWIVSLFLNVSFYMMTGYDFKSLVGREGLAVKRARVLAECHGVSQRYANANLQRFVTHQLAPDFRIQLSNLRCKTLFGLEFLACMRFHAGGG